MTETSELRGALGALELFENLQGDELDQIVQLVDHVRQVDEGDSICEEGSPALHWWIVLDGEADVTIGNVYVGSVGEGETIGELAALDDNARSATVTARTDTLLAEISTERFDNLLDLSPSIAKALLRQMSARLRSASTAAAEPTSAPTLASVAAPAASPPSSIPADFDPLDPAFFANPYEAYGALRETGALYNELIDSWIVGRYDDVERLMKDRAISSDVAVASPTAFNEASAIFNEEIGDPQTMGRFDGPDHQRIRRLVTSPFTPKAMRKIRADVEELAIGLLENAALEGDTDFVEAVALPLPSMVISRMLGVPEGDQEMLHELSLIAARVPEPLVTPEQQAEIKVAVQALRAYMLDLVEVKRAEPADDVLSGMVHAHFEDERLSRLELVDNAGLMYIAGHLTTVYLLTSMVALIWDHPDQLERLRREPGLAANAVEETLRFESPLQFGRRFTMEPITFDDQTVPAGASLITAIASANRDPRHWGDDAHLFRVDRPGAHKHLTFAAGAHFCAGAALARMEGEIVLQLLLQRYPEMRITSPERTWGQAFVLHGLDALQVQLLPDT